MVFLAALYAFVTQRENYLFETSFFPQAVFLFILILASQIAVYFLIQNKLTLVVIVFQMVCSIVITYPLGDDVLCRLLLYSAVILNCVSTAPLRIGGLIAVAFVIFTIAIRNEVRAWGTLIPGPTIAQIALIVFSEITAGLIGFLIASYRTSTVALTGKCERLDDAVLRLTGANAGFQEYADTIVGRSLDNERKRISRELHDTMGYALTNIRMMTEEAIGLYDGDSDELVQLLISVRNQAQQTLTETRSTLQQLRKIYVDIEKVDLKAVFRIARTFEEATRVKVTIDLSNSRNSYGGEVDRCVYRIVQEGMTNAIRHGRATAISIYVFEKESELCVSIQDNGAGSKVLVEGIGLSGMQERVVRLGGTIQYRSDANGFHLVGVLPIIRGDENGSH